MRFLIIGDSHIPRRAKEVSDKIYNKIHELTREGLFDYTFFTGDLITCPELIRFLTSKITPIFNFTLTYLIYFPNTKSDISLSLSNTGFKIPCSANLITKIKIIEKIQLNFNYWIQLFTGGISFLGVYLVTAPLIRAVDKKDVASLRELLSGLGPFSYVFNIPLKIMEKLLSVFEF